MQTTASTTTGIPTDTGTPLVAPNDVKPVIELIEYNRDSEKATKLREIDDVFECRDNELVSWVNIGGLGDVAMYQRMAEHFHLHPLAIEDVFHTNQRPKVEDYAGHLFIVTQMVYVEDKSGEICAEQVSMFLSKNILISIQEEPDQDVFEPVRHRILGGNEEMRGSGADHLAYALLDAVTDHFFPLLETVGESLEDLETELLDNPTKRSVEKLHHLKRTLLLLRRVAWPQRELLNSLQRDQTGLITPATKVYLRDCYDHLVQIMDIIENYREMASSLMDIYLSAISIRTNDIMRVLTVISVIFIPLTFIAGVYGMNFDPGAGPLSMPELKKPYGYVICVGMMALIAVGQLFIFWKKGWLKKDA
jgi:magnesium transporter